MKGQLTIIDLNQCEHKLMKDKKHLALFGKLLSKKINMIPYKEPIIKRFGKGNLKGYSAVQLIETSNITTHLDEHENKAFIDIFSCKKFDSIKAKEFTKKYFKAKKALSKTIERK